MPSHVLQVACLQCSAESAPASQYLVPWQYQGVNLLKVACECNRLFGVNAGRVLLRSVAAELGDKALSMDQLSGTRKLASLEGAPAHLYRNYKLYFSGLAVRMLQSERGIGSQTKQSLTQVGRRLSSGTFVVFMLCFEDLLWLGQGQEI